MKNNYVQNAKSKLLITIFINFLQFCDKNKIIYDVNDIDGLFALFGEYLLSNKK